MSRPIGSWRWNWRCLLCKYADWHCWHGYRHWPCTPSWRDPARIPATDDTKGERL